MICKTKKKKLKHLLEFKKIGVSVENIKLISHEKIN